MPADIQIHQTWYAPQQRAHLDPAFLPLDNTANPYPDMAEYYLFSRHYHSGAYRNADLSGVVSWSFFEKANLPGSRVIAFIRENPGFDVYLFNPFPHLSSRFPNPWHQAEAHHPGILGFAQAAMDDAGHAVDLASLAVPPERTVFCNYWIGTRGFWDRYMAFSEPVSRRMLQTQEAIPSSGYVGRFRSGPMSYYAFVMERLVSTLLAMDLGIRVKAFAYPPEYAALGARYWDLVEQSLPYQSAFGNASLRLGARLHRLPGFEPVARLVAALLRRGSGRRRPSGRPADAGPTR